VKQGKPLQRKTPLRAKKPMQQGTTSLRQRTPLKTQRPGLSRQPGALGRGNTDPITRGKGLQRSQQRKPTPPKVTTTERRTRKLVAARSDGFCEKCGTPGATDMAHRISRGVGGGWECENILHLCRPCHTYDHQHPRIAYQGGWHLRSTQNPATTPVWLHHNGTTALATLNSDGTITWATPHEDPE